jgi:hypothetical protein
MGKINQVAYSRVKKQATNILLAISSRKGAEYLDLNKNKPDPVVNTFKKTKHKGIKKAYSGSNHSHSPSAT